MIISEKKQAEQLSYWKEPIVAEPLAGGITNTNFKVHYQGEDYVVRIGEDIPEHGVMRFNELNASVAGFKAGLSPEIVFSNPGALVMRFVLGKTLTSEDIQQNCTLERILPLLKKCHYEVPKTFKSRDVVLLGISSES